MNRFSMVLGVCSGFTSLILWVLLNYYNPYANSIESEAITRTAIMILFPACLTIYSSLTSKKWFLLFAFIWSLPFSLYFGLSPGIFALFGITSFCYFVSFLLMQKEKTQS